MKPGRKPSAGHIAGNINTNIGPVTLARIDEMALATLATRNRAEVIRRAIALYWHVWPRMAKGGKLVLMSESDGDEVIVLPV